MKQTFFEDEKSCTELTKMKMFKKSSSKTHQGCFTGGLQYLQGVLLPEQHSQQQKQAPACSYPGMCTNTCRRGLLAAVFPSFQLHHPFHEELGTLSTAGHHGDLCNMLPASTQALQAPWGRKGCSSNAPVFSHPPHPISACFCSLL